MSKASSAKHSDKISRTFAERLARLKSDQEIRAFVLPVLASSSESSKGMTRAARKKAASESIATVMKAGFTKVDRQTSRSGGQRITKKPNTIGFIQIKAPADTIYALAKQKWVKSILEDQPIRQS